MTSRAQELAEYRAAILRNACSLPKNIFALMYGVGCWESTTVAAQIEYLVAEGFLTEQARLGPFFQHRYFVAQFRP